jgi:hypothetical protein
MRNILVVGFVGLSLLSGCGQPVAPVMAYGYKPQKLETKEKIVADMLACRVQAANKIPSNVQITSTPGYSSPVTCSGYYCSGGYSVGGTTSSFDANASLRTEVYNQCFYSKGYKTNTQPIPVCRPEQIPSAYGGPMTILYPPETGSCLIFGGTAYSGNVILRPQDQIVPNS